MAKVVDLSFDKRSWKKVSSALKSSIFRSELQPRIRAANTKIAMRLQGAVRKEIEKASTAKNAALTIAIKKSTKPLVDFGDLYQSVSYEIETWDRAVVGFKKTAQGADIARVLHDGVTIPVTEKMRGLFLILAAASRAQARGDPLPPLSDRAAELFERFQEWYPLRPGTRVIVIPPRPVFKLAMNATRIRSAALEEWKRAIAAAFEATSKRR